MKTTIAAILAATLFAACGKKEEVKPAEPTVAPAAVTAPTPAASEPAKTEEVKK